MYPRLSSCHFSDLRSKRDVLPSPLTLGPAGSVKAAPTPLPRVSTVLLAPLSNTTDHQLNWVFFCIVEREGYCSNTNVKLEIFFFPAKINLS